MTDRISLKNKLKTQTVTIGSWITLGHPAIAEIMAKSGFDWLTVDMEHSAITLHQAQQLVQVIELAGCVPLVRVGENNPNSIKRAMDTGAHGVIVPSVNSKEDAVRAVHAVKYPPLGTRGVGLARAQGYGMEFEKYKEWVNKESVVVVQIESIQAVQNLKEILRVKGVDAFIVGPYDLSGSMGRPGDFNHPDMTSALKRIMKASERLQIPAGFHVIPPDVDALLAKIKEGYKFLAFSLDTLFLGQSCKKAVESVKRRLSP
jgi:2-dehydro-3-deoxyglucarate aldolase